MLYRLSYLGVKGVIYKRKRVGETGLEPVASSV
jgi:hypothetical protein